MDRYNIFQRMEREIDFQFEYEKIEEIVLNEMNGHQTIENQIENAFESWEHKENYLSFWKLRVKLGFSYDNDENLRLVPEAKITKVDEFILYCDMMLNMLYALKKNKKKICRYSWSPYI